MTVLDVELDIFSQMKGLSIIFDVGARMTEDSSRIPSVVDYLTIKRRASYHLFEPNPNHYKKLVDNVKAKNVTINQFGLGDEEGKFMYREGTEAIEHGEANEKGGDIEVGVKRLDKYCRSNGIIKVDFIKIDTEGYDYKVLLGAGDYLKNCKYIQYEHWDNKEQFHKLLKDFDIEYIGYRNVFCMNKALLSKVERDRLKKHIKVKGYAQLL